MACSVAEPCDEREPGRRLYIHDYSLRMLAGDPDPGVEHVAGSLMAAKAMRVIGHHLEAATDIGALDRDTFEHAVQTLRRRLHAPITELLRRTVISGPKPATSDLRPLLHEGEAVTRTCFDDGYWTFATSHAAAARMYADHEPLRQLYRDQLAGVGAPDLTMVRGPMLRASSSMWSARRHRPGVADAHWSSACAAALLDVELGLRAATGALDDDVLRVIDPACAALKRLARDLDEQAVA